MKPSEVKRKTMTSLAYGPCLITSLMPWKKDMGSDLGRQDSGKRKSTKEWTKMQNITLSTYAFGLFLLEQLSVRLILYWNSVLVLWLHYIVKKGNCNYYDGYCEPVQPTVMATVLSLFQSRSWTRATKVFRGVHWWQKSFNSGLLNCRLTLEKKTLIWEMDASPFCSLTPKKRTTAQRT